MKNMKKIITLALPVFALALTSCGDKAKTVSYDQMRRFASETYDQYALDTVPASYTINFNKFQANAKISYITATGGTDSYDINFALNDTKVVFRNLYSVCLSSALVDNVERYYSDFVGIALSLKEEPPIKMAYQLLNNNRSKIDFSANEKLFGSVLIKLLQFVAGALDMASAAAGYIPSDYTPGETDPQITKAVYGMIMYIAQMIQTIPFVGQYILPSTIFKFMNLLL